MLKLPTVEAVICKVCGKPHLINARTYIALDGHITRPFLKEGNVHYQTCIGTREEPFIICLKGDCIRALMDVHEYDFLNDPSSVYNNVKRVLEDDRGDAL